MAKRKKVIFLRDHRNKKRVDIDPQTSSHKGFWGLWETGLRRFKNLFYVLSIAPLYFLAAVLVGVCLTPGVALFQFVGSQVTESSPVFQCVAYGTAVASGFFLFGFSLILVVPAVNFALRTYPKSHRGPYYSVDFIQWYVHNALTYLVRYTFLEFITPTPFNILFLKLMGMKIGRGTQINTAYISDPALISMGKGVTIGGSVTLCAHYAMGGYLIVAPVKIGNGVTVGLKATIMGAVEIGDGAKILPHSAVLPKTVIPAGETWGGVPAVCLSRARAKVA